MTVVIASPALCCTMRDARRMEEFRRHARWCPAGHPPGGYRLDVFTEYAAFPVWERAGMSNPARLGISADLSDNLRAWQDWWEQRTEYRGGVGGGGRRE